MDFQQLLKGANSPGVVFRLDEFRLRTFLEKVEQGPLRDAARFVDTADTQRVVLHRDRVDPCYLLDAHDGDATQEHAAEPADDVARGAR